VKRFFKFVLAGRAASTEKTAGQVVGESTREGCTPFVGGRFNCSGDSVRRKVPSSESAGRCSDIVLACAAFVALYFFWFEFIWEATAR
jgi:hypothetical protein